MTTDQAIMVVEQLDSIQTELIATNTYLVLIVSFLVAFSLFSFMFMRRK